jgi:hypothetical protein
LPLTAAVPDYQAITLAGTVPPTTNIAANQYLAAPNAIAYDSHGLLYYSDGPAIWRLNADGTATSMTANISQGLPVVINQGYRGNYVAGMALDSQGNLFVADPVDLVVRKIAPDLTLTTFAGTGKIPLGASTAGPGVTGTQLALQPEGVAVDANGNVYIADGDLYIPRTSAGHILGPAAVSECRRSGGLRRQPPARDCRFDQWPCDGFRELLHRSGNLACARRGGSGERKSSDHACRRVHQHRRDARGVDQRISHTAQRAGAAAPGGTGAGAGHVELRLGESGGEQLRRGDGAVRDA